MEDPGRVAGTGFRLRQLCWELGTVICQMPVKKLLLPAKPVYLLGSRVKPHSTLPSSSVYCPSNACAHMHGMVCMWMTEGSYKSQFSSSTV